MEQKPDHKVGGTILIIGQPGAGKSPSARQIAEESGIENKFVYDRRREYDANKYTVFYELNTFYRYFPTLKNCVTIVEEATGFVSCFKEKKLTDLLIGIEHNSSILILIFHSILDCPEYVLRNSRYYKLFDTLDDWDDVKRARKILYPYQHVKKPVFIDRYLKK